jgi:hypothetical protein
MAYERLAQEGNNAVILILLGFLCIPEILKEQAKQFALKARQNQELAQESLMSFIEFQKGKS